MQLLVQVQVQVQVPHSVANSTVALCCVSLPCAYTNLPSPMLCYASVEVDVKGAAWLCVAAISHFTLFFGPLGRGISKKRVQGPQQLSVGNKRRRRGYSNGGSACVPAGASIGHGGD